MADTTSDGRKGQARDERPATGENADLGDTEQTEALFSAETLTVSKILFFGPDEVAGQGEVMPPVPRFSLDRPALPARPAPDRTDQPDQPVLPSADQPALPGVPEPPANPDFTEPLRTPAATSDDVPAAAAAMASDGANGGALVEAKPAKKPRARRAQATGETTASVDGVTAETPDTTASADATATRAPGPRAQGSRAPRAAAPAATSEKTAPDGTAGDTGTAGTGSAQPLAAAAAPARRAGKSTAPKAKKVAAATAATERGAVRAMVTMPADAVVGATEAADGASSTQAVPMADQAPTTSDATAADAAPTEAKPAAPGAGVAPNAAAVAPDAARAPAKRTAKKAPATARTAKKAAPASGPDRPADTTTADTTAADTAPAAASAPPKKAPVKRAPARQNAAAAPVTPATPAATAAATAPAGTTAPVSDPAAEPAVEVAADSSDAAAAAQVTSPAFAVLAAEPYISLTTFRKSGTPVPTPVWAAPDGGTLLVWTGANSGKVKRIRHTPGVTVAPCDRQGRLLGDPVPATARVLGIDDLSRVKAAMTEKYGWQFRMSALGAALGQALRIAPHGQIALEITVD